MNRLAATRSESALPSASLRRSRLNEKATPPIPLDVVRVRAYRSSAMKTFISLLLYAAVFTAPNGPAPADRGPTRGKVLVLENEQPLVGDIERVGDAYRVRRLIGETTVPASRVLRLCADMNEAFQFVRSRANLSDADECLRLG